MNIRMVFMYLRTLAEYMRYLVRFKTRIRHRYCSSLQQAWASLFNVIAAAIL